MEAVATNHMGTQQVHEAQKSWHEELRQAGSQEHVSASSREFAVRGAAEVVVIHL